MRSRRPLSTIIIAVAGALLGSLYIQSAARAADDELCCADLEARIAELEATTARKGNDRVSVTATGWINEALFAWDDGTVSNAYVGTNFVNQSRFSFVGKAKISDDLSTGYTVELGLQGIGSEDWGQEDIHRGRQHFVSLRQSKWSLGSKTYGKFTLGLQTMATYFLLGASDLALTADVSESEGPAVFLAGFRLRHDGQYIGDLRWSDVLRGFTDDTPGNGPRRVVLRYDTPVWGGFSAAATFGENHVGDFMVNYLGDIGDYKVNVRGGYAWSSDPGAEVIGPLGPSVVGGTRCVAGGATLISQPGFECEWGGIAGTVMHRPTGLYLYGGWGHMSTSTEHKFPAGTILEPNSNMFFAQPGIEYKWSSLGRTNFFAQYRRDDAGSAVLRSVSSDGDSWQAGLVQEIEASETLLYLVYQNSSGSVVGNEVTEAFGFAPQGKTEIDSFQMLVVGAQVSF
jgi:hypothetical protein